MESFSRLILQSVHHFEENHILMSHSEYSLSTRLMLWVEGLSKKRHQTYLFMAYILAALGYVYFLIFPVAAIIALYWLVELIQSSNSVQDWIWVGSVSFIASVCIYQCFNSFKINFSKVQGIKISETLTPGLCEVIKEIQTHYRRSLINSVVITDQFEIRLEYTPISGVPVLFSKALVIGLPMLQTLSPEEFRCEVARCIGQHSGFIPRLTLFIYKSRALWRLYSDSLLKSNKSVLIPFRWFFVPYSHILDLVAIPALRDEVFIADASAMDYMNENEVLDTLKSESISRTFLELHYWSSVRSMVIKNQKAQIRPFAKLEKVLRSVSTLESRKKWLNYAYVADQHTGDTLPALKDRMEDIGHTKIRSVPMHTISAAEKYLGKNMDQIISIIDKLWRTTTLSAWIKEYKEQRRDLEAIQMLSRKSRQQLLWPGEIIQYSRLARKFNGSPYRMSIRKLIRRNIRNILPAFLTNKPRQPAQAGNVFR